MSHIACPQCRAPIVAVAELAGQTVSCPQCGAPFVMPSTSAVPQPPPPPPLPSRPSSPLVSHRQSLPYRAGFRPSSSLFDIFDIHFEKYVTPLIAKITWIFTLAIALLWLIGLLYDAINTWIPHTEKPSVVLAPSLRRPGSLDELARDRSATSTEKGSKLSDRLIRRFWIIFRQVMSVIALFLTVLWIRVALESMIVLFRIAKSLSSIDDKIIEPQ